MVSTMLMIPDALPALVISPSQVASMVALVDADNFVEYVNMKILNTINRVDLYSSLAGILNLHDYKDNTRNAISLDFYCYILSYLN